MVAGLKKHLAGAPFKRMTQLEVTHGLLLDTFDTKSLQGLLVLDWETMSVVYLCQSQLNIKIVRAGGQGML